MHARVAAKRSLRLTATTPRTPLSVWRSLSASANNLPHDDDDSDKKQVNVKSVSAGLPDFIEHWDRKVFRQVGYGMVALTAVSFPVLQELVLTSTMTVVTGAYWYIGLRDIRQPQQTIRRNFPVVGNMRYLLEMIRPEIRQYFVEGDDEAVPFDRNHRGVAYQRSKGITATMPFGTRRDANAVGYEWANHTLYPTQLDVAKQRVLIGGNNPEWCTQPYSSSLLNISAMSYGALSDRAILALSAGAKLGKFSHNTGEGALSDFHKQGGGDLVWNIGTAYFGCGRFAEGSVRVFDPDLFAENAQYAKMIEIKLSQGAKPAHGGMLPKEKISPSIAKARNLHYPVQEDCHSPARHNAFSNPTELCHFIQQLRTLSNGKPVGFKLCLGQPEEFCQLVQAFLDTGIHPDFITVDGSEGGTGAAPPEFSNSVGTPLADGLSFAHAVLVGVGLRDPHDKSKSKVALICSGKILTGFSMYKNFAIGADVCNAARAFLFSLGCIQALKCNDNKCPTGITTQDPELSWGLDPTYKQVRVANFQRATVQACVELMEATGLESWSTIRPGHVTRRVDLGRSKPYDEIFEHLQVGQGDLLHQKGPDALQTVWNKSLN
ncbi:Glutamate synthase large subunit-like protein YerD [Seminavis robusta]|uniref:Glutamate synthase large subunit-like protein YerD n=1 Tax=Seminavis robusta TaxID=568900 RepID=A0A9N8E2G7_9STRA|nr:Glutamate synthase large subunit-like protein YerD [Seminavis robusta]|eukprot:Sro489_g153280.1 Glutamate synthase large subunit-like protein YerD (604) ;mRNA; f:28014-29924